MTLDELRASVRRVLGADLPMTDPQLLTRIVGNSRQAYLYRAHRILIAGDAAHVYSLCFRSTPSCSTRSTSAVNSRRLSSRAPSFLLYSYLSYLHLSFHLSFFLSLSHLSLPSSPSPMTDADVVIAGGGPTA